MNAIVPGAVLLWLLGAAWLAMLGLDADATWRLAAAATAGAAVVIGIVVALWRRRPAANLVALLASLAIAAILPSPTASNTAIASLALAIAAILVGYYILQLSLRTNARTGPVLRHGGTRILGTVAAAASLAAFATIGVRTAVAGASPRLDASLDVASGQLLIGAAALIMTAVTGLSLLAVSRVHKESTEDEAQVSTRANG